MVDLLAAMGVAAHNDAAVEAAFEARGLAHWGRVLPAAWTGVAAADASGALGASVASSPAPAGASGAALPPSAAANGSALPLRLPEPLDRESLLWSLRFEDGQLQQGHFQPCDLPEAGRAGVAGTRYVERSLSLPVALPAGYHRLTVSHDDSVLGESLLIAAPACSYVPPALEGDGRAWGATAQLYAVRSQRNWGLGDFSDLVALVELWGGQGASLLGVNPLHAMFPHNPAHASPYSPSSRLFLNTLYLDIEAIDDFDECEPARRLVRSAAFEARLQQLRAGEMVDYAGVAEAKRQVLGLLYQHFRAHELLPGSERGRDFLAFVAHGGEALRRHALFEALQQTFHAADPAVWGWPVWPPEYRSPDSRAVEQFAREQAERVGFYQYLQWQADRQLGRVGRRSFELGLGIGLYQDLAVSIDRAGAEAWADQLLYAGGVSIGAPPDDFNLQGQNWGLPPMLPQRLQEAAYAPFIATLRANMKHAGALRIDHVMALRRLYWIAEGAGAAEGAYVNYPFADLLAESFR